MRFASPCRGDANHPQNQDARRAPSARRSTTAAALVGLWVVATACQAFSADCGDADGNGAVTVSDGVQVLRAAAGLPSSCTGTSVCDVDASGTITVSDAVDVLRAAAGLTVTVTCGTAPSTTPTVAGPSSTPTALATPSRAGVSFPVMPCTQLDPHAPGFQVRVQYPTSKGHFTATGTNGGCQTSSNMTLAARDQGNGTLSFLLSNATPISFPVEVMCTFDVEAGQTLTQQDLSVVVRTVAVLNSDNVAVAGDPGTLCIGVAVVPQ